MGDNLRIEELRRRVQKDPASIAFAQLSEEHRRAGHFEESVEVAKAGLAHHPAYLSARVTLGRALLALERLDEAAAEFEYVVQAAPDNLTAVRQLADIHQRRQSVNESKSSEPETHAEAPLITEVPAPPAPDVAASPAPTPPLPAVTVDPPASEDMILIELEAWLAVLAGERGREPSPGSQIG